MVSALASRALPKHLLLRLFRHYKFCRPLHTRIRFPSAEKERFWEALPYWKNKINLIFGTHRGKPERFPYHLRNIQFLLT